MLFLTNNKISEKLFEWLADREKSVIYSGRLTYQMVKMLDPGIIVSYNYRYLIQEDVIDLMKGNIVNLHISYLPWNKGADPNFWSFVDNTPKGVSIHLVDKEIDAGDIIVQKLLYFDETKESFLSSYQELNRQIVALFQKHWDSIKNKRFKAKKQLGGGSIHYLKDMEEMGFHRAGFCWNRLVSEFKENL